MDRQLRFATLADRPAADLPDEPVAKVGLRFYDGTVRSGKRRFPCPNPNCMPQSQLIVCERTGVWAAALARLLPSPASIRQTRCLADSWQAFEEMPAGILGLEVTESNLRSSVALLAGLGRQYPLARAFAMTRWASEDEQWLLREAGAVDVAASMRQLHRIARIVQRHLDSVPTEDSSLPEAVWAKLPWGANPVPPG
jgi:hypothetical protein